MTTRQQAIEAAAVALCLGNLDDPGVSPRVREAYQRDAAHALAAAVPVLLNDLADRIEAERKQMPDTESTAALTGWVMRDSAIIDAVKAVRAAAEGWGQ